MKRPRIETLWTNYPIQPLQMVNLPLFKEEGVVDKPKLNRFITENS